ncbi:unnamed protein product [Miscanthus lutarioriparius]|uniref:DUF659 domain-containing protein n=1 Tax=Miscanthus lutarioriparius TaxID=422564 RepID=A0A811NCR3_9POAL|nr:unnamed protein product [Miscanthus lutarioriparius]
MRLGRRRWSKSSLTMGLTTRLRVGFLMEMIPTLFWSPCATHCLDLMLEEIGKLQAFKKTIARARRITTFIHRHERILSLMREKTGGADLMRPAVTRFASSFLTLKSLHKHKDDLKALFYSEEWSENKLAKTNAGDNVHSIVFSVEFWNSIEDCLRASAPLLIVLRVVDGDEKPAMLEVAALMNHAKEKIKLNFDVDSKKNMLKKILKIIDKRWVKQMNHPLYGAALYLNPEKLHPLIRDNEDAVVGQLRGSFHDMLARMIYTKKRNRLLHKRLNAIVFVSYNWKMKTRFQIRREKKGKSFDPLVIDQFDWDNEWVDCCYVHPQGLVEEDSGSANEEEEDSHDDADVSNCEDAPSGTNGDGENVDATNVHDEFDDGLLLGKRKETSDHQKGMHATWNKPTRETGTRRINGTCALELAAKRLRL